MKVRYWTHSDVNKDGTHKYRDGAIRTDARVDTSGKHHLQTRSTVESGLWMLVSTGRLEDGTCHGLTLFFDDEDEMRLFSQRREISFN
jgi:hypothetical protein